MSKQKEINYNILKQDYPIINGRINLAWFILNADLRDFDIIFRLNEEGKKRIKKYQLDVNKASGC